MSTGNSFGDPGAGPLPGTSFSSDPETADQRSPPDSNAHKLEGGRPTQGYTFYPKRKCSRDYSVCQRQFLIKGHVQAEGINAMGAQTPSRPLWPEWSEGGFKLASQDGSDLDTWRKRSSGREQSLNKAKK